MRVVLLRIKNVREKIAPILHLTYIRSVNLSLNFFTYLMKLRNKYKFVFALPKGCIIKIIKAIREGSLY